MTTVLVSACLLGYPCRWHGRPVRPSSFMRRFVREHPDIDIVPVCPEELGGLTTPRPPVKVRKGRAYETCAEKERRVSVTGRDVTAAFQAGAEATLTIARAHGCGSAILFRTSPSCARTGFAGRLLAQHGIDIVSVY